MAAHYHIKARTDNELYWSSYLYCGIFDLEREGLVSIEFIPKISLHPTEVYCTVLEVTHSQSGSRRVVAVDWRDNPDFLCHGKLAECDLYFKRNYIPSITHGACPPPFQHKIRPAGLSFSVRGERERPLWVQLLGGAWRQEQPLIQHSLKGNLHTVRKIARQPIMVSSFLRQEQFESAVLDGARNVVLFQTKAYDPRVSSFPDDTRKVTEERAAIIRALKEEFRENFIGGFLSNPFVQEKYPDCMASNDDRQSSYVDLIKSCRICIYTRGLRDSPAFKLGEYLASSRCIVAERPNTLLPRALENGREVLYFETINGLVDHCRRILADDGLQRSLSAHARSYYQSEVKPKQRVLKYLQEAFSGIQ